MIAAVADSLATKQGLQWPRVMAPFEAAILATEENIGAAEEVWDLLAKPADGWHALDAVLDDREDKGLGSQFSQQGLCEVSIPRLGIRLEKVAMGDLRDFVGAKLDQI
ncbi:MAG: hypothetical protein Q9180_005597 [Flavoplaca navasiana]